MSWLATSLLATDSVLKEGAIALCKHSSRTSLLGSQGRGVLTESGRWNRPTWAPAELRVAPEPRGAYVIFGAPPRTRCFLASRLHELTVLQVSVHRHQYHSPPGPQLLLPG